MNQVVLAPARNTDRRSRHSSPRRMGSSDFERWTSRSLYAQPKSVGSSSLKRNSSCSSFSSTGPMSARSSVSSSSSIPSTPIFLEHQPPFPQSDYGWSSTPGYRPRRCRRTSGNHRRGSRFYKAIPVRNLKRADEDDIDALDLTPVVPFHHEGPYDAASRARNVIPEQSPMQALGDLKPETGESSHEGRVNWPNEARAQEERPHPPPGTLDRDGRVYEEDDGSNIMFDVMCLQGHKFTDEDFKNDPFYNDPYPKPIKELQEQLVKLCRPLKPKSRGKKA